MNPGAPLYDLDMSRNAPCNREPESTCRKPSDITLVRSRTLYAKPALTARGFVQTGFKHIRMLLREHLTLRSLIANMI